MRRHAIWLVPALGMLGCVDRQTRIAGGSTDATADAGDTGVANTGLPMTMSVDGGSTSTGVAETGPVVMGSSGTSAAGTSAVDTSAAGTSAADTSGTDTEMADSSDTTEDCEVATPGCPCTRGGACNPGYDCVEGVCVFDRCAPASEGCECLGDKRVCDPGLSCIDGFCVGAMPTTGD